MLVCLVWRVQVAAAAALRQAVMGQQMFLEVVAAAGGVVTHGAAVPRGPVCQPVEPQAVS